MTIIGYTFWADVYCPECRWELRKDIEEEDEEENEISPIFSTDEMLEQWHCSDCHEPIE